MTIRSNTVEHSGAQCPPTFSLKKLLTGASLINYGALARTPIRLEPAHRLPLAPATDLFCPAETLSSTLFDIFEQCSLSLESNLPKAPLAKDLALGKDLHAAIAGNDKELASSILRESHKLAETDLTTALHTVVKSKHLDFDIALKLMDAGANIHKTGFFATAPFYAGASHVFDANLSDAQRNEARKIANEMISRGADFNVHIRSNRGQGLLYDPFEKGILVFELTVFTFMLPELPYAAVKSIPVSAAFFSACVKNREEGLAIAMLKAGARPDTTDWRGKSMLSHAIKQKSIPLVQELLTQGASTSKRINGMSTRAYGAKAGGHEIWSLIRTHEEQAQKRVSARKV